MTQQITVKSGHNDNRAVLWERHPDHPDGEVFISGDGRGHTVARTPAVQRKLASGALVEIQSQRTGPAKVPTDAPPWHDYDDMTAGEITTYLAAVPAEQRAELNESVRQYEMSHKARKTILEALD